MKAKRTFLALLSAAAGAVAAYYLTEAYKRASAKCPPFRKRIYSNARELVDAFRVFWEQPELLLSVRQNPVITPAFSEKLLLAVTGAHGCRYCTRVHSEIAKRLGLTSDEWVRCYGGRSARARWMKPRRCSLPSNTPSAAATLTRISSGG